MFFCEFWSKVKQSEPYCSFKDSLQGFIKSWCFISVYQVSFKKFETGTIWVDLCCPVKNIWSNFVKKHIWFDQRCIFSTILTERQYEISSRVLICFSVPKSLLTKLYEGLSSLTHTFLSRVSYIFFWRILYISLSRILYQFHFMVFKSRYQNLYQGQYIWVTLSFQEIYQVSLKAHTFFLF